ncbi:MAG: cyclic nucleotide-binding domain-containing protein [Anaerolineales bacterium]|jgi:CRP-like cAMP-binding protein
MLDPQAIDLLHELYFLRGLDKTEVQTVMQALEQHTFSEGDIILQQGTPARDLYLIVRGTVELLQETRDASQRLTTLEAGDTLGERELAYGLPWQATVRAVKPSLLLRWDREDLTAFLQSHPDARSSLRLAAKSRNLASRLRFDWIASNEVIYGLVRRHAITLVQALILPVLLLLGSIGLTHWALSLSNSAWIWLAAGVFLVGVFLAIWQIVDWLNDYYMVTNRRVVWLEKMIAIYDNRQEAPLHMVLSVSVSTEVLGRLLGYGNVIVRTYTGQIVFRNIGSPHAMADLIEAHWRRAQSRKSQEDQAFKELSIRSVLDSEGLTDPLPDTSEVPSSSLPDVRQAEIGLGHWTLEVRFEKGGIITYRKHWAVLLRRLAIPTLCLLLGLGALGARLSGLLVSFPRSTFVIVSALWALLAALWGLYEYVDWANDIYQITPDQIVDIKKKPLSRQISKVAPIENILGTEVDRKGIMGLVLNYGNVITIIGTEQFIFQGVYNPIAVQQDIVRALDAFLESKKEDDRRQRRQEMVEWLRVYHEQAHKQKPQSDAKEEK